MKKKTFENKWNKNKLLISVNILSLLLCCILFSCTTNSNEIGSFTNINGVNKKTYETTRKDLIKNGWVEIKVKSGYMDQIEKHFFYIVYQNYIKKPMLVETTISRGKDFKFCLVHWEDKPEDPNFMAWGWIKYQNKKHYFVRINYNLKTDFMYKYKLYDSDHNYLRDEEIKVFF